MRLVWKIAVPFLCAAVIGGAVFVWSTHKAKVNAQHLVDAAQACRVRADQGDPKAEYETGHNYYYGEGVPQSYAEALRWYRKAADQGDAKAQYGLGFMCLEGQGKPQDYAEALLWFRKAADQGYSKAQYNTGRMYYHGQGVQQDSAEAARWYRKAADQGYALGQSGIGFMLWYGYGVKQDRAEAKRWFRKAADQGDEYATRALSSKLTTGKEASLLIQLVGGLLLTFGFLSFNIFESGEGLRSLRQRVITGTGILCLFTVWLSWYGYTHHKIRCLNCGVNAFTVTKWLLDAVLLALLIYIVRTPKKTVEPPDEIKGSEINGT